MKSRNKFSNVLLELFRGYLEQQHFQRINGKVGSGMKAMEEEIPAFCGRFLYRKNTCVGILSPVDDVH